MRLTEREVAAIKKATNDVFGESAQLRLFGSRTNDFAKGGDIDLMITVGETVSNPAWAIARVEAKIIGQLGDQKIDIVLNAPNLKKSMIHRIAHEQGIVL